MERNQPTLVVVDFERMLDKSHRARADREFVGGLDLSRYKQSTKGMGDKHTRRG